MRNILPHVRAKYGWKTDGYDERDLTLPLALTVTEPLPPSADLRQLCPPVVDQGQLGSCTANAIAGAMGFDQIKQALPVVPVSRLFIYANERIAEGTPLTDDSGAQIRDGIKSVAKLGVCPETEWPYVVDQFSVKPPEQCYLAAKKDRAVVYQRVTQTLNQLKACLASGWPFVFGFTVYESFESQAVADTGIVPMPLRGEQIVGGHAVVAVGYTADGHFIVRNSWGDQWGQSGYFLMPAAYLTNPKLASDIWQIKTIV